MTIVEYRDHLGRHRLIQDVPACLCSHAPHRDGKCPALACGCLVYRPDRGSDPETAA